MPPDLSANFEQILQEITLSEPQVSRMNSAANTVAQFLADSYDIPRKAIFLQGSYANHTAIEPIEGGEYDVDLVAVCVDDESSAGAALNMLETRFREDGRFQSRVRRKQPCVRLDYAEDDVGKFHVDVVPTRRLEDGTLEAPRRNSGWHATAPAEYTAWCTSRGDAYLRTVKMLKRWRGEHQTVRGAITMRMILEARDGETPLIPATA